MVAGNSPFVLITFNRGVDQRAVHVSDRVLHEYPPVDRTRDHRGLLGLVLRRPFPQNGSTRNDTSYELGINFLPPSRTVCDYGLLTRMADHGRDSHGRSRAPHHSPTHESRSHMLAAALTSPSSHRAKATRHRACFQKDICSPLLYIAAACGQKLIAALQSNTF